MASTITPLSLVTSNDVMEFGRLWLSQHLQLEGTDPNP